MNVKYLAVDSDITLAESEAVGWAKRHIGMDRVDNMTDGIKMLLNNEYLYIGINDDAVCFMPLLRAMRSITDTPILIATNHFCTDREVAALRAGADLFANFHATTEGNIDSVLAHVMRIKEENKSPRKVLIYKDLLIALPIHEVFIHNTEIILTKKEFDILWYLIDNQGILLTYSQIIERVWGVDNANADALWTLVKRLRKKLAEASPDYENCIENTHGLGYRLTN
jgi:two-component system alkaline phosphatase synthesis response regulator PhoP